MDINKEQILQQIVKFIINFFSKQDNVKVFVPTPEIDWANPKSHITPNFTVEDACMLHGYNRLATEADGMDKNLLISLCNKMEEVRAALGCSIDVHCMFRSEAYNQSQGISPAKDVHSMNVACDFDCGPTLTIDETKNALIPLLDKLNIRLERGTTTWVHIDMRSVGPSGRYFTP